MLTVQALLPLFGLGELGEVIHLPKWQLEAPAIAICWRSISPLWLHRHSAAGKGSRTSHSSSSSPRLATSRLVMALKESFERQEKVWYTGQTDPTGMPCAAKRYNQEPDRDMLSSGFYCLACHALLRCRFLSSLNYFSEDTFTLLAMNRACGSG